jgi:hypothetical protein
LAKWACEEKDTMNATRVAPAIETEQGKTEAVSATWAARAPELAAWTSVHLVNRSDVWGAYWPLDRRQQGNSWTAPAKYQRGKHFLTQDILERHFRGRAVEDLVGLHSTSPQNTSRWGGIDIDKHDGGRADPENNLAAALTWYQRLLTLGIVPLLTGSNGAGGYHLRVIFREPVPTPRVFAFLQWLVADFKDLGLAAQPETFPKQPHIGEGKFGNWLRLFGRHHTNDYWSEVWDGTSWLAGARAVSHLLTLEPAAAVLIPGDLPLPRPPALNPREFTPARAISPGDLDNYVGAYMAQLPHCSAGEGRDNIAFKAACWLVRDMRLGDAEALEWLEAWDAGNRPPKGREILRQKIAGAHAYGRRPYGVGVARRRRNQLGHRRSTIRFTVEL